MGEIEALLGSLLAIAAVISALSLVSFVLLQRRGDIVAQGNGLRFVLLTGPVLAPLLWTAGASIHEMEPGSCLGHLGHHPGDLRVHITLLVLALALPLAAALGHHLSRTRRLGGRTSSGSGPAHERIRRLARRQAPLRDLRIVVLAGDESTLRTRGIFWPRVEIGDGLASGLPEESLLAALFHEREHVRSWDPMRRLALAAALTLNPVAFLLTREAENWRFARELACDRDAVASGADALDLASALVAVARPGPDLAAAPALARGAMNRLHVRVGFLLSYATHPPVMTRGFPGMLLPFGLGALLLVLPHVVDAWPIVGLYRDFHAP